MKIEKVNDNQIRCTLTQQDLASRHIKLSELAYGTDKAKMLFRDMMQQANYEFGFEAEDIPLMIEAIPISSDKIVLIITKVEYPDELDTRFSRFSDMPEDYEDYVDEDMEEVFAEAADDILGLFRKMAQTEAAAAEEFVPLKDGTEGTSENIVDVEEPVHVTVDLTKLFIFHDLRDITRLAHVLKGFYDGDNSLFRDENSHTYYLIVHKSSLSPEVFNKVCNILAEYGKQGMVSGATEAYLVEHHKILCRHNALQTFASL